MRGEPSHTSNLTTPERRYETPLDPQNKNSQFKNQDLRPGRKSHSMDSTCVSRVSFFVIFVYFCKFVMVAVRKHL